MACMSAILVGCDNGLQYQRWLLITDLYKVIMTNESLLLKTLKTHAIIDFDFVTILLICTDNDSLSEIITLR